MVKMGDVWDRTIECLGDRLTAILPVAIFAIFVPSSITGSLAGVTPSAGFGVRGVLALVSIGFGILSLWGQLVIAALAIDAVTGAQANRLGTIRLLPAIGLYLLGGLALMLVFGVQGALLGALGAVDLAGLAAGAGAMQRIVLPPGMAPAIGLVALVEAFVLLALVARLAPLSAVIVAERRGLRAYARAFRLTRGLTWKLIGVILLYAVVMTVSVYAAQTVFGSILGLLTSREGPVSVAGVLTAVIVAAVSTTFTVLAVVFGAKLYVASAASADATLAHEGERL